MADRATIKAYFQTGDTPTQAQFEEWMDSIPFLEEPAGLEIEAPYFLVQGNSSAGVITTQAINEATDGSATLNISAGATSVTIEAYGEDFSGAESAVYFLSNAAQIITNTNFEFASNGESVIIRSPDGTRYKIAVANGGALSTTPA